MYSPGDDFFSFNLKYLCCTGLWVNDKWIKKYKVIYRFYKMVLDILSVLYVVIVSIGCYLIRNDFALLIENLVKTLVGFNYLLKIIRFSQTCEEVKDLIKDIMNSGDMIPENLNKIMTMFVVTIYLFTSLIIGSFAFLGAINYELPVEVWLPLDTNKSVHNFLIAFQIILLSFTILQCRAVAMQGIVCSLIMYLCEQLDQLQIQMKCLDFSSGSDNSNVRKEFKAIIKKHARIIRYVKSMRVIFQDFFLIQNLAVTLEMCLNAVMVTSVSLDLKRFVTFMAFLLVALLNAYLYCYLGNELIAKSKRLALVAYETNWTSWPTIIQKDLLIIITVSQRPLFLSAGELAPMSIQTFSQTLYNGYSLFAVLQDVMKRH